ncbi:uncharacterized protein EMH_0011790 [Eimeria mitis]|uniref:Transmembrane protein n=1 Tax=Eimeria mitis TaxID=44415 RepID=U6JT30_9EIME|nr:uncharacterized protein EMH_0011790 [Eimeria mitis]CDJ27921.1 hypothetical protein EMH_0011790 [Eimeria mitis]
MQKAGRAAHSVPPVHIQLSNPGTDVVLLHFAGESSLRSNHATRPYISHRNDSPLFFRPKRKRGHRRFNILPVIFAALVAFATVYLLLRCARYLVATNKPKGVMRSVSAVDREDRRCEVPISLRGQGEPARVALSGESPDEGKVLQGAEQYISALAKEVKDSRTGLLSMPASLSVKVFSSVLRHCVVELAALTSLLEPAQRKPVEDAVEVVGLEIEFFSSFFKSHQKSRARLRHMQCMHDFLLELPRIDFAGDSMPRCQRISKLEKLLTLQEVALTQMQDGVRILTAHFQQGGEPLPEDTEKSHLDALYQTTEVRRNHVLRDNELGQWLRHKQAQGTRFGLAAPNIIQRIVEAPEKSHEELLEELRNTPLGKSQQHGKLRESGSTEAHAKPQQEAAPLPAEAHAGEVETNMRPSKSLSSSEPSVKSGQLAGVGASASQASERSGSSERPALLGGLGLPESVGASAVAGAAIASSSSASAPSKSLPLTASGAPVFPAKAGSHGAPETFSSSDSSAFSETSLQWSSSEVSRDVLFSGQSAVSNSANVYVDSEASDLATAAEPYGPSDVSPQQVTGHLQLHGAPLTLAPAGQVVPEMLSWLLEALAVSSVWQYPQTQLPGGLPVWKGGPSKERAESHLDDDTWPEDPANHGLWGRHAPASPSQHMLPGKRRAPSFQGGPSARRYASGRDIFAAPGVFGRRRLDDPESRPPDMQHSPGGRGTLSFPPEAVKRWQPPDTEPGIPLEGHLVPKRTRLPFKGVAVGEPAGMAQERETSPAARVTAALFSSTSADPSKALLSLRAHSGEAGNK